jgi:uncharacterized SAM-binding protein YcdF (DUF218 family)
MFLKRHRFRLGILLFLYAYCISIAFTGDVFSRAWKIGDTFDPSITYDAVVVLAGFSQSKWHLEREGLPYIPADFFAASSTTDRILAGIYFVQTGQAKQLLAGHWISESSKYGAVRRYDEGRFLQELAADMGLQEQRIHLYGRVKRTVDEAEGVKRYVETKRLNKLLLVTSELHMRRALALFRKQGLHPHTFSVNKAQPVTWISFVPGEEGIASTKDCLYELVGYIGYYLKGSL